MSLTRVFGALLCVLVCIPASAAEKPKKVKYAPPTGVFGHRWGELRKSFTRLPEEPLGVYASWMRPVVTGTELQCSGGACGDESTFMQLWTKREGGGFHVLSEYAIEQQGMRFNEADELVMYPIVYQFCANWVDDRRVEPPNFSEINKFCGVKLMFDSDTAAEIATKPADYVTNYDRVLDRLIEKFGRPEGYYRRGQVVIESAEGEVMGTPNRKFRVWRWCPARGVGLHTTCSASVTLSMDVENGVGTVLYSTPSLWEFAFARRERGFEGEELYMMLYARK